MLIRKPPYAGGEKFGSPAINPQPESGTDEETPDETPSEEPETTVENAANDKLQVSPASDIQAYLEQRNVVIRMVRFSVKREQKTLSKMASGGGNFMQWLDSFYGLDETPYPDVLAVFRIQCVALKDAGVRKKSVAALTRELREWARERKAMLVEIASNTTKDMLAGAVNFLVMENATEIAYTIINKAIKEDSDVPQID